MKVTIDVDMENNEGTSFPWWFIVDPYQNMDCCHGTVAMNITGPYFNRKEAEDFLKTTRFNFGKRAIVWCGSGHNSRSYREAIREAKDGSSK